MCKFFLHFFCIFLHFFTFFAKIIYKNRKIVNKNKDGHASQRNRSSAKFCQLPTMKNQAYFLTSYGRKNNSDCKGTAFISYLQILRADF